MANPLIQATDEFMSPKREVSWLLVFDSAVDPDILDDYRPATGVGVASGTSRNPVAREGVYAPDGSGIDLPPLPNDDANQHPSTCSRCCLTENGPGRSPCRIQCNNRSFICRLALRSTRQSQFGHSAKSMPKVLPSHCTPKVVV